mmetsp:Transcript_4174/g.9401  ORF Transcript_4174/g.9401 Transcript_4174/m.9401 type:complete len:268 (+) Transcript_4174:79-882(+)
MAMQAFVPGLVTSHGAAPMGGLIVKSSMQTPHGSFRRMATHLFALPAPLAAAGALVLAAAKRRARTTRRALTGGAPEGRQADVSREARGGNFDPSAQVGATEPLGFWDPAGFAKDQATFEDFRGKELKHGRVAMMCILGFLGQHFWRFPSYEQVPDGVYALTNTPGSTGFACFFLITGFFELRVLADLEEGNPPGNFGDPFKLINTGNGGYDDGWRNFEINNGRLAMIGAIGTITANWYTGLDAFEQWNQAKPAAIAFVKATLPFAP